MKAEIQNQTVSQSTSPDPLAYNPIYQRERLMHERSKANRNMKIVYGIFGALFLLLMCGIGISFSNERSSEQLEIFSYTILASVLLFQVFVTLFFVPPFTAGGITEERKRETFDILLTTTISPSKIIEGKLFAALPFTLRLVFLASFALIISLASEQINLIQVLISQIVILVTVTLLAIFSLYLSTLMRSTLSVMITVYGVAMIYTFASGFIEGYILSEFSADGPVGLNLFFTLVAAFIPDEAYSIISPLIFVILHGTFAYLFYRASISRVQKIANR